VQTDDRPLPESLTRLLAATASVRLVPAKPDSSPDRSASAHAALESALLRGFVYGVSGLVWLVVMLFIARHFLR
jgi:hypothetical protein